MGLRRDQGVVIMTISIVEFIADKDDCAFAQPCQYGHRVEGHAVYCHNDWWKDAPGKCRRTWYTGGKVRDEDCSGYRPNLNLTKVTP